MKTAGLLFLEDEVSGRGAGGDLDPVGNPGGDVGDVSGVEGDLLAAFNAGAASFAGGVGNRMLIDHRSAGDEGNGAFVDDYLVGPALMLLGVAGVDADDEERIVGAEVVDGGDACSAGTRLGGGGEFGFELLEFCGGVDGGCGGLREDGCRCECEGQEDALKHSGSLEGQGEL
jgi:hypothetical protein